MKRHFFIGSIYIFLVLFVLNCAGNAKTVETESPSQNQGRIETASNVNTSSSSAPYFTGDGRKDMSLAILVPESQRLGEDQSYLPIIIQGCLVANISKYSAIRVLDRVALEKVITETLDPTYMDNLDIVRLGHITQTGYIMTGSIISGSFGYTLTINVTDTTRNPRTIAYSGNFTLSQLNDQTAIQLVSKELLTQMGVALSGRAIAELSTTNQQSINAQTVLARGITAQRQGFEIQALSYYFQAARYDPSLPEAVSRSEILAANISSGRIGDDLRNDVQWRRDWIARLAETEEYIRNYNEYYYNFYTDYYNNFYNEYNASWDSLVSQMNTILNQRATFINNLPTPPYTLYYAVDVRNSGFIDYRTETTSFSGIKALLRGGSADWKKSIEEAILSVNASEREMQRVEQDLRRKIAEVQRTVQAEQATIDAAIREVVQAVNNGLNATGRREIWGLQLLNAQLTNVQFFSSRLRTAKPDVPPINRSGSSSFSIAVELVNSQNKIIGRNTFRTSGTYSITNTTTSVSDDTLYTVDFANVNVNDITDNLTVRIANINGIPAESASRSEELLIQAVNTAEWNSAPWNYTIQNGQITQYMGKGNNVTIPSIIWGETVTAIGDNVFANNQLTSVTIGANVTSIGNNAFANNRLTRITIGVNASIGNNAFANNPLTSATIGANASIGNNAFANNLLTSVNIGANVALGSPAIGSGFEAFYNRNGKLAGIYMRRNSSSRTWGFDRNEIDFDFDPTNGTITGYTGNTSAITIPETIGGIPVTAIANGVFRLPQVSKVVWKDNFERSRSPLVVINIGKDIKLDNSAFTVINFGEYYSRRGRKAGTYSYTYTSNGIKTLLMYLLYIPTFTFGSYLVGVIIPDGHWNWKYTKN